MHICKVNGATLVARFRRLTETDALSMVQQIPRCSGCVHALLAVAGELSGIGNRREVAEVVVRRAWALAQECVPTTELAFALAAVGEVHGLLGNLQDAEVAYRQALDAANTNRQAHELIGPILVNLANIQQDSGHLGDAKATLLRAIDFYVRRRDKVGQAEAWGNLGNVLQDLKLVTEAIEAQETSLQLYRDLGSMDKVAESLTNLSLLYAEHGDGSTAVRLCQDAVGLLEWMERSVELARAFNNLGLMLHAAGEPSGAKLAFTASAEMAARLGDQELKEVAIRNMAALGNSSL